MFIRQLRVLGSSLVLAALAAAGLSQPSAAQVLGYEVSNAETEAGRLRHLAQRLAKQNLLYQLHLGDVRKSHMVETASRIDRVIETLELGSPGYAVPAPWTPEIKAQLQKIYQTWGSLRSIALANPYEYLRKTRQYASSGKDPLVIRYFDTRAEELVAEVDKLMALYDSECKKTGTSPVLCVAASISGYSAMLSEKATKEAIYIAAGIDVKENRARLAKTMEDYERGRQAVNDAPFFEEALSAERGQAAKFAVGLLQNLRTDWDEMTKEFRILNSGDEKNFDLERLLKRHDQMVARIERFTAAMVRYANIAYAD